MLGQFHTQSLSPLNHWAAFCYYCFVCFFSNWIICFFLLSCMSSLYFWILSPYQGHHLQVSSTNQLVVFLFCWWSLLLWRRFLVWCSPPMVSPLKYFLWLPVRLNIFHIFYSYIQHVLIRIYYVSGHEPGTRGTQKILSSWLEDVEWQWKTKQSSEVKNNGKDLFLKDYSRNTTLKR